MGVALSHRFFPGGRKIVPFQPYLRKCSILTNMFQMGWKPPTRKKNWCLKGLWKWILFRKSQERGGAAWGQNYRERRADGTSPRAGWGKLSFLPGFEGWKSWRNRFAAGWKITIFNREYIFNRSIFQPAMLVYQRVGVFFGLKRGGANIISQIKSVWPFFVFWWWVG